MAIVKVVDLATFQQGNCLAPDLIGGPVVKVKLPRTPTDVDAALAHRGAVAAVDALVPVPDEEQIVRGQRD